MILTERTINIIDHESIMDSPVVLYRGDKNVELKLNIKSSKFKFRDDDSSNFIESAQASYGQLIIQTPNQNEPIFSEITATKKGYIIFVITAEMIDEIDEVGKYTFQVRLLDSNKRSRATIPPVVNGIEIREPITSEDSNVLNSAVVGLASAANEEVLDTFDEHGDYAKTNWKFGDKITAAKLNKSEDGIYQSYALGLKNISDLAVERERINLLTKIENGQTEGNTELLDIRVGANGVVYGTAGDSVRQQFLEIDTKLNGGDLATVVQNGTYFDNFENIVSNTVKVSSNQEVNAFSYFKNLAPFSFVSKSSDKITIDEETDEYIIMTIQPNAPWQNIKLKSFYIPSGKYVFTRSVEYLVGNAVNNAFTVYMDYSEDGINYTSDNRIAIPSTVDQTIPTDTIGGWRKVIIHITLATPFDVETKVKLYKFGCFKSDINNYGEYEKYRGQQLKGNNLSFNYSDGMKICSDKEVTVSYQANIGNSMSLDAIRKTITKHEADIQELKTGEAPKLINNIVCWGDSLTDGAGNNKLKPPTETNDDCAYPAVLGRILGNKYTVINGGVGGETSWMIAARQGGMAIQVLPNTIPANTTPVRIYLKGQEQDYFYNTDSKKWTYSKDNLSYNISVDEKGRVNPCYINGIEGTLSRQLLSSGTADPTTGETVQTNTYAYYFTRKQAGEQYTFRTPKTLITNAFKNYRDWTNVIWMGQNDAPLHDGRYITQIGTENRARCMIEHLTHDRYIIMDLPSGDNVGSAERVQSFSQEFGKHYLNIREYICKYGIVIANELGANITVSTSDQELINKGRIPGCLRIDGVHGNYWYYQIVARAVFEKGQDLGYW